MSQQPNAGKTRDDSNDNCPWPIDRIAARLGFGPLDFEPYGWHAAKLSPELVTSAARSAPRPARANYVLVTATNPTPLGEGKTITTIGLAMGLERLGASAIATLREPSMGPLFGVKGGGAGGGRATLLPREQINLHFTGDFHAVTSAANLLAAIVDNHMLRGNSPTLDPTAPRWPRAIDVCDRALARLQSEFHVGSRSLHVETGFWLTPASEIMAVLALARDFSDLRRRLGQIVVGRGTQGEWITAEEVRGAGALAALLRDALRPNLVQTCEHTPAFVHAGPFANIAHGNSSVLADLAAIDRADFVVTEAGFGADCGAEKFFHVKCRASGLVPNCIVLVTTLRALKLQSGRWQARPGHPLPPELFARHSQALAEGLVNLEAQLDLLARFGPPIVVAINRFPEDDEEEFKLVERRAIERGASRVAVSDAFARGGEGAVELAEAVRDVCRQPPSPIRFLYELDATPADKLHALATQVYGADGVDLEPLAARQLSELADTPAARQPICVAKTPYSLSHDPRNLGRPTGFRLPIREIRWSAGAGFLYALAGDISTMPGLPAEPRAYRIDLTAEGRIVGLE